MPETTPYCSLMLGIAFISQVATATIADSKTFTAEQLKLPGKRGACFTLRNPKMSTKGTWDKNLPRLQKLKPYWNYSWGASRVPQQDRYITSEFVPMIWSGRSRDRLQERLKKEVIPPIKDGSVTRILGFNEPDGEKQANMPPELALELWPQLEALGIPLCSPSAVHADKEWMATFMKGVREKGYRVDYIGVHSYGGTSAEAFKKKLRKIYELHDRRPLLITEFAAADWNTKGSPEKNRHAPERVMAFAKDVLPWMERQDWIAGYAWFSFGIGSPQGYTSALFDADGNLTALGRYYASITTDNPDGDQGIQPDDRSALLLKAKAAASK